MHINDFPTEILNNILFHVAKLNERDGVQFTFGLCQPPGPAGATYAKKPQRYVRGPVPPHLLKMDSTASVRSVCRRWREWGCEYAMRDVYVRCWRGSERWCDLALQRSKYDLYEMIDNPRGEKVYRDPHSTLRRTRDLLASSASQGEAVRRLWFDGLYLPETDAMVLSTIHNCQNLQAVSIPWTVLRHGSARDWIKLLGVGTSQPLRSLELLSATLSKQQTEGAAQADDQRPLMSLAVDFSQLKRLKLFGDTNFMPITDEDLKLIARTATNLEEFQVTCMSTISIEGVMAIVSASRSTLRVLEHSPRSMDGFYHPHPGTYSSSSNTHLCELLTECPKLTDLSISLPSVCSALFKNREVRWRGDFQVRALHICGFENADAMFRRRSESTAALRQLLASARSLATSKAASFIPTHLSLELFFAACIFEPHVSAVHGDFRFGEYASNGCWPSEKRTSRKGPYGSTGLYGKDEEETPFDCVEEAEFLRGVEAGWVSIA